MILKVVFFNFLPFLLQDNMMHIEKLMKVSHFINVVSEACYQNVFKVQNCKEKVCPGSHEMILLYERKYVVVCDTGPLSGDA